MHFYCQIIAYAYIIASNYQELGMPWDRLLVVREKIPVIKDVIDGMNHLV